MPKRDKYVPTHRDVPERSALRTGVRTTIVYTGVAAVATGVSVSGGVFSNDAATPAAASDLIPVTAHHTLTAKDLLNRTASVSRSADDRRARADKLKQAALSNASGVAKTKVEKIRPTDPKTMAQTLMPQYGLSASEFGCLDRIWTGESGWNVHADNPTSDAYGIPQALPGSKMASAGADWATNAETQIRWGLGYIRASYGSACNAWNFKMGHGWY